VSFFAGELDGRRLGATRRWLLEEIDRRPSKPLASVFVSQSVHHGKQYARDNESKVDTDGPS
jgi:hypothetical protein